MNTQDWNEKWDGPISQPMGNLSDEKKSALLLLAQELDFLFEQCDLPEKAVWQNLVIKTVFSGCEINYASVKHKMVGMIIHCWSMLDTFNMTLRFRLCNSDVWQIRNHKVRAVDLEAAFGRMEELLPTIGAEDYSIQCRKENNDDIDRQ